MTDEVREKYLKVVNIICEQFGLNKPNQIIYVCEAVENLIEPYMKENAELKKDKEYLDKVNNEQTEVILKLNEQIEKMKCCCNCSEPCWNPPIVRRFECLNNNHSLWELAE